MFDASMTAPFSYFIAIIVLIGLLAIFVMIVRRVASQGPNPESGHRGRGPRLGLVDSFSLDKERQLVIVRRDDVEHLLMIGGTSDVVIETNIVRALGAQSVRESSFMTPVPEPVEVPIVPQPQSPLPAAAPRLRPTQPNLQPHVSSSVRLPVDHDAMPPMPSQPAPLSYLAADDHQDEIRAASSEETRQSINQSELIALAKRLEASIPPSGAPKIEKPAQVQLQAQPQTQAPPVSLSAPIAPPAEAPPAPAPVTVSLKPQPPQMPPQTMQPLYAPEPIAPPAPQQRPARPTLSPQMRPAMPQAPVMPQTVPLDQPAEAPQFHEPQPLPMPQPLPVPSPAPAQSATQAQQAPVAPDFPKDRQAAALDENLRRLLGRKIVPK